MKPNKQLKEMTAAAQAGTSAKAVAKLIKDGAMLVNTKAASQAAESLFRETQTTVLDDFAAAQIVSVEVEDKDGQGYKLTRVDGSSTSIDLDALKKILTPAQRKKVITKRVQVVEGLDQAALNDLINNGSIVPNTVPYIITPKAPYVKVTPIKRA